MYRIAFVYAGLGDNDQAFEWLEKAFEERSDLLVYLNVDPALDRLRSDPRLTDLARRVGYSRASDGRNREQLCRSQARSMCKNDLT